MNMKRLKRAIVIIAFLMIGLLATGCGSGVNLSASMSGINESEDTSAVVDDDYDEYDESDEYDETEESDDNYSDNDIDEQTDQSEEIQETDGKTITVVLNTNKDRKRIHIPDTSCANQIHEENYLKWTGTENELIEYAKKNGYVACGRCHPDTKLGIDLPKKD